MRVLGVWVLLAGLLARAGAEERVLKVATLAPEGSAWMRLGHEWADALKEHTAGRLRVKFFPGGVAGDEREMVRKVRMGQLAAAAVTTVGLGMIHNDVLVLQHPMFLRGWDELEFLRTRLDAELRRKFLDRGFVLLAWTDVGDVHIFSRTPVRTRADAERVRVWAWVDDPVSRSLFQSFGLTGVPLGVPDVLPALATGAIDVCYGSPLVVLALQWHPYLRYMSSQVVLQSVGAMVMAQRDFDALPAADQRALFDDSKSFEDKMRVQIRDDNARALAVLKRGGMQVFDVAPELVREFQAAADRLRGELDGPLYDHGFRMRVEQLLAEHRARADRVGRPH